MPAVDQSRWRFVITDMSGNQPTGSGRVLNASSRQFTYNKNAGKTAQFTLNIDSPVASYILGHDCLMKVYRQTRNTGTWQRLMIGDVIHADESGQGDAGLMTVVGADPWWRLQRRLIGMGVDSTGRGTGYTDGSSTAMVDNSQLIAHMITNINSVYNTGIVLGTVQNCGTNGYINPPVYSQNVGDMIQQFCNVLGGPDFEFVPGEPFGLMPGTNIATMNIWQALGQSRPNCIFEYGVGQRNVASYDRILSKDGLCNLAYSPPQGFPSLPAQGDGMITAQDTGSQSAIGLYQDLVQSDLVSTGLRQELCNEYIQVRSRARQQITFTPTVDCPLDFGVDYNVGDTVGARAFVSGGYRYNGTARIYGVDFSIDDNDAETPALVLIPGG